MTEWNLKEIYINDEAWSKDLEILKKKINEISKFKDHLKTEQEINDFFVFQDDLGKLFEKLYSYVAMNYDKNQKDLNYQALMMKIREVLQEYSSNSSFVDNEILELSFDKYVEFAKNSKAIKENLFNIKKIFDGREHVLSTKEEMIISNYQMVTSSFARLYAMLQNSDFNPIDVTLSTGEEVKISPNTYTSVLMRTKNQDDRRKIFEAQFSYYQKHENTLCTIYKGIVDSNIAKMRNRGYKSILSSVLDHNKIPEEVYLSLINTVKENTAPLKRYIALRKKLFNLEEYHTYDRFLHYSKAEVKYPFPKAYEDVLKALQVMGDDFVEHAKIALKDGHVDVYPSDGKRSGAYSTGVYGYGPYILLNHTDTLDSAFTLAHECGHSIHTLYSEENQPYASKDYLIFVAEIPSTLNEQIFLDYLIKNSNDKELKIQAIEQQMDGIVSTFYRQTLFADFEYQAHQLALDGKPFTYESLCEIIKNLYYTYYGIDLDTEPLKKFVWAYIPHLYNSPFYVYQYATCFSASMKIYQDIKAKKEGAFEKYIEMLKMGGSDYPIEIVKKGGVDLTSKEPFLAVCNKLNELIDEYEELIK